MTDYEETDSGILMPTEDPDPEELQYEAYQTIGIRYPDYDTYHAAQLRQLGAKKEKDDGQQTKQARKGE